MKTAFAEVPQAAISFTQDDKSGHPALLRGLMNTIYTPTVVASTVTFGSLLVDGLNIAYREAGDPSSPKLVLLHGWPASSHQFRELLPALASRFHVIAPDYPGFGNSDTPDPALFAYTFDQLAKVTESFLKAKGFEHLRALRAGLWWSGRLQNHDEQSVRFGLAHHPEYECVRSRLQCSVGRLAQCALA